VSRALAWCDPEGGAATVWRERGDAELRVVSVASVKVGGMLGLLDAATRAGMKDVASHVRPADRGNDAADALRASGIADVVVAPDAVAPQTKSNERRIVAISREPLAELVIDEPAGAYYLCSPPLDTGETHAICIESAPHQWRPRGSAVVGIAYAPLPFWLSSFSAIQEPDALNGALALISLARRLDAAGFAPTILSGATETPKGVDVLGRAKEDSIVAVGLQPKAPWLIAYTDGAAWDIASDEPRVVPLAPFAHALLSTDPPPTAPKEARRTVVFRHAAAAK
jgi:hypothetical protein